VLKPKRLLVLLPLVLLLAACGPNHRDYTLLVNGKTYTLTSDRIGSGTGWSRVYAAIPDLRTCIKWESDNGAGVSCLPGRLFDGQTPKLVSSRRAGSGWTIAELKGASDTLLCIKWQADYGADISCFKADGAYGDGPALIDSRKAGGGWSIAEIQVPGQQSRLCYKWSNDGGKGNGGGALSCAPLLGHFTSATHPSVSSHNLGHGWSLAKVSAGDSHVDALCLKWENDNAGAISCFPKEADYTGAAFPISTTYFDKSGWSVHEATVPHYAQLTCLKWSTSGAGGMGCLFPIHR
jgi:hypothetical protein